jgi:hypothetical protein
MSGAVRALIGVAIRAGATELTRTPVVASSLASAFVIPITAALLAEYALRPGLPSLPAMLAMFTILPHPRSTICGTNARQVLNVPVTLTAKVLAHSASSTSTSGLLGPTMPALLTRMSIGPTSATTEAIADESDTSTVMSAPSAMSSVNTRMPSVTRRCAAARPSPLAPPVMSAVRIRTEPYETAGHLVDAVRARSPTT